MSLTEIEAELERLTPDELRCVALRSWSAFVARETSDDQFHVCDEEDPQLLVALDKALARADVDPGPGYSGSDLCTQLGAWTTR